MIGDLATWVQTGVTILVFLGGIVAYIHNRTDSLRRKAESDLASAKEEITRETSEMIAAEREERRREVDRLEKAILSMQGLPAQVSKVAQSVEHLSERFGDNKAEQARAVDEIKHTVREIFSKVDGLAVELARGHRD